ncbi:MAG: UDP-N-acetylmuramoylalanyl-D-glutamyl-2,6-diaminopimelate--D-alanyl-D-alanine ligase [Alphaproteobacteria bacterium]|nr:UDP-N-acetylmuramoylalanyl-D-glutamyl-2,6-diaminopimelate--D-alanyl-D-alanine ligase [Alphaproteobacteria bacterium]MBU0804839.1 UDP-N-acetylmuramoylalanyl-D-glutamyl-2,6-diaminopimelate--D-alanyl-D-alanine ligase [Alphaproteobacteria bacterium]MBU0871786.1 UDP-N-acetylmuramoylalanyl-D-glutamyl-2,6-diaminopimelate--D-alanyl-D-alanine ligase [Alphaproteobacteria bacterium]MBU1403539.1 UDP-N-acetylmuramoylalanyl-D-glutamyl-2,6-diaminopimelate--D-alanyl-D-alanine ligase [Alphaproteobacteria bact
MSLLWLTEDLIDAMGGRPIGTMPEGITGISIDSRSLKPGDAFFAIKGETMDGHDFATAAVKAGAGLLVVAEGKLPALGRLTAPMIVVPDVLVSLEKAGIAARARTKARVIAITGSAGKTSTKEALRHVLSQAGKVHASDKSFNNHWGVPLTLARMPADTNYAIFEIGMNHEGEIRPLVKMVRPHIAIVTLIAAAHLGHFKSLEDIARAKAEIFEGVEKGGVALINRDDANWALLSKLAKAAGVEKVAGFGEHAKAVYRLTNLALHPDHSLISAKIGGKEVTATIGAPGRHVVQNALAVLGAAHLAGADVAAAALALAGVSAEAGRGKRHVLTHPKGSITLIDESYNANPASMQAALALLDATPVEGKGRRIAVLGDMLELGSHSERLHAGLAELIARTRTDLILLAGPEMKSLAAALPDGSKIEYRTGADELKPVLLEAVGPGDVVMVKSSKGIGFSKLIDALVNAFPADAGAAKLS